MLYPLLTGLHLAGGGRIVAATPDGVALVQHGVKLKRTPYHTLTLTAASATVLQHRLDEASIRAHSEPDTAAAPSSPTLCVGDEITLEDASGQRQFWVVRDAGFSGPVLERDGERKCLRWHSFWQAYRGHVVTRVAS